MPMTNSESPEDPWLDGFNRNCWVSRVKNMFAAGEEDDTRAGVLPLPDNKVSLFGFLLHALPV